ncbi:tuftelin 1b [Dunckerocampus dactyliophorus]|uniref:tuftelin 1b n=1 Tax=Dunckerocampus dactyliophorus TaxID=161453 RepID=UPI00240591E9|nr:tuftelin 1b [Dunckerocampus dactyliophorus]
MEDKSQTTIQRSDTELAAAETLGHVTCSRKAVGMQDGPTRLTEEQREANMGSFWKKISQAAEGRMLRFSRARCKCSQEGAAVDVWEETKMTGGGMQTVADGEWDNLRTTADTCRRPRLTLQDHRSNTSEWHCKESSVAVVLPQKPDELEETPEEEKVEVIKVYLDNRPGTTESVRMLTDEVSQIQEVRYCLKTLREQMAARQNSNMKKYPSNGQRVNTPNHRAAVTNGNSIHDHTGNADVVDDNQVQSLREETKRLYAQMKDMESRHREERERLQMDSEDHRVRLAAQSGRLQKAEEEAEKRGRRVEELQRLLANMEAESGDLQDKMAADEAELLRLKADKGEGGEEKEQRCNDLEKEVAALKEKIHHLDDMLKSQQRKVRHMIEQLQNSRTVLQERDRVIKDLEEKVAFLEAENREMHDHMDYFLSGQDPPPLKCAESKPVIIYSKPLTPSTHSNKSLPFIKVIEIKS